MNQAGPGEHTPDLKAHKAEHTPAAIRRRLADGPDRSYLRDFIYGAIDGAVTTFAVVSGVAGAGLDNTIIIILGLANLVGDGFSMAAGNFLGVRAEQQERDRIRRLEERHILEYPEGEREEIRQIFKGKGFDDEDLERAVDIITADRENWVRTMLTEEHGLSLHGPIPWRSAAVTFGAFLCIGFIPLLPFVAQHLDMFGAEVYAWSAALTGAAFFLVGAWKSVVVEQSWWVAGLETLLLGSAAAGLAYAVGALLAGLVG